jgi:hypothetical protein
MRPLTSLQRRALHLAARKGGTPTGTVKGTIRLQVANVLLEHEWVTIANGTVLITRAGRAKLNEPIPDVPVFLHKRDGLTTRLDLAVRDEPEVMVAPHEGWHLHAEAHRKLSRSDLDAARLSGLDHPEERLRELRRMAAGKGIDVTDELRFVNRGLKALERKVRGEAA